ncbi:MAG TPA: hypothetical protein HPQ03_11135 [Deltaproteobacteria bacterium]|nr:hypothetical protein [Deltaproteobacteria bacterium]
MALTTNLPPNRVTDLIALKKSDLSVSYRVSFEILPVDFAVTSLGKTCHIERCLACYPKEREEEKPEKSEHHQQSPETAV